MNYRAAMWKAIRRRPRRFTAHELSAATGASLKSARAYVYALLRAGVIEFVEKKMDEIYRYRLVHDTGPVAPRHDGQRLVTAPTARYRVWQAVRVLRQYSHSDLVAAAECTSAPARQLCADLKRAGYVRVIQPAYRPAGREARYALLRDTGPLPLVRHNTGALTDPNTNEVFES